MEVIEFIAAILATWAIAAMLYFEYGPWDCFTKLRNWAALNSEFWHSQLECFWCCTRWAAIITFVLYLAAPILLYPLAFSGAAVLLSSGGRVIWREMTEHG